MTQTSTEKMRKIKGKLMWGSAIWFLWGIGAAIGKWLGISAVRPDKTTIFAWFGFGILLMLAGFIADCTEAVISRIDEKVRPESSVDQKP